MKKKLIIHAVNIHQGGGRRLLLDLLKSVKENCQCVLLIDSRFDFEGELSLSQNIIIKKINPTIVGRFIAEWWLLNNTTAIDKVFCFGNLPPLFRLKSSVSVYVQNRYLVDLISLKDLAFKTSLRIMFERQWLKILCGNGDMYYVQTPSMFSHLRSLININIPISIKAFFLPFQSENDSSIFSKRITPKKDVFIYVASGEAHKNHRRLIEAWIILAKEGIFPELIITIDQKKFVRLLEDIRKMVENFELRIINIGSASKSKIDISYSNSTALIFPSVFESYGLPLLEAQNFGLPIIASELDYVRDLVDPIETFDPYSPISIANGVKRFLNINSPKSYIYTPSEFMENLLDNSTHS